MAGLHRAFRVFWSPRAVLSEAVTRPLVVVPLVIPTLFAAVTSLVVYLKFAPPDPSLRGIWLIGLSAAILGPAVLAAFVSASSIPSDLSLGGRSGTEAFCR